MTEFWENHLHVAAVVDAHASTASTTGTRFASTHWTVRRVCSRHDDPPGDGIYLDDAESNKDHPNENLGRELLELHTLGVGNYTESDVRDSPGSSRGGSTSGRPGPRRTDPTAHWVGHVKVGSFTAHDGSSNGRKVTRETACSYLAHHPDTGTPDRRPFTAFVHDPPPQALAGEGVSLAQGTIRPVPAGPASIPRRSRTRWARRSATPRATWSRRTG